MPLGTSALPGPGLFPITVGIVVALLSVALLFQAARERDGQKPVIIPAGEPGKRVVGVWLALAAYAVLVNTLGHALLTGVISVVILRLLGMRRWGIVILLAAVLAVGSYYLFAVVFEVPLPEGIWMP
jgi:putative tricarboxylic transport membrane protein